MVWWNKHIWLVAEGTPCRDVGSLPGWLCSSLNALRVGELQVPLARVDYFSPLDFSEEDNPLKVSRRCCGTGNVQGPG